MVLLSILEFIVGIVSMIVSLLLLISTFSLKRSYKFRIMNIFAGLFLGFFFSATSIMLGGLDYLIFLLPNHSKPMALCNTEGLLRFFGGFIVMIYQILTDLAVYWNVFNFKVYLSFVTYYIKTAQYIIFLIATILSIIPLIGGLYGSNLQFPEQSCYIDLSNHSSFKSYYNFMVIEIPALFSFFLDLFVIIKIGCFYFEYSKTAIERHYIISFLCYPAAYFILITPLIVLIIIDIAIKIKPSLNTSHEAATFMIVEQISFYLNLVKPLIIGAIYAIQLPNFKYTYAYVEKQSIKEIEQIENYVNLKDDYRSI